MSVICRVFILSLLLLIIAVPRQALDLSSVPISSSAPSQTLIVVFGAPASEEALTFTGSVPAPPVMPISTPTSAPAVPTSEALVAQVTYERGGLSGHLDRWGRWLDNTDALGHTTTYQRDEAGNLLQRTYPDGSCDAYVYDQNQNLTKEFHLEAAQCPLAWEDRDLTQIKSTWYTYEPRFNHLKTKIDDLGHTTTYIYDYEEGVGEAGNLIRIEYPQVEDETGNPVTPMVRYSYKASGQISSVTDERGAITRYVYTHGTPDEAAGGTTPRFAPGVTPVPGLLTQVIKDDGGANQTTTYTDFDAPGNPLTVIGPGCGGGGQVMHYTYDALGRALTKTDALNIVTKYAYDAKGNVRRKVEDYTPDGTTGKNIVTEYTYDPKDRLLKQRTTADGNIY